MSKRRITPPSFRTPNVRRQILTFTISSNGENLSSLLTVLKIQTFNSINSIPTAIVDFVDPDFELGQASEFLPGCEWEIKAGYQSNEEVIFKGIVLGHRCFPGENGNVFQVQLKDEVFKMNHEVNSKIFTELSDKDIVEELVGEYSVDMGSISGMNLMHESLIQMNQTDWSFLLDRAKSNACFVRVNCGEILVAKVEQALKSKNDISFYDSESYDLTIDAEYQSENVIGKVWIVQDQEMLESSVKSKNKIQMQMAKFMDSSEAKRANDPYLSEHELDQALEQELSENELQLVRGFIVQKGRADLLPGTLVILKSFGKYLSKEVFMSGVEHQIEAGKWTIKILVGLDPQEFRSENPSLEGLHIGLVTETAGGQDNNVKVKIPVVGMDSSGVWARLSSAGAGNGKGILFRPDIGDEVIISFLGGSIQNPVILGGLNSSLNPSPVSDAEGEKVKGIFTKGGLKLVMDDDDECIELITPEGNKVYISEDDGLCLEDKEGNSIKLDSDGISISSQSDLNLSASGDINLNGININASADSSANIFGDSGAELKSNATTTVKGSLIQIN